MNFYYVMWNHAIGGTWKRLYEKKMNKLVKSKIPNVVLNYIY